MKTVTIKLNDKKYNDVVDKKVEEAIEYYAKEERED